MKTKILSFLYSVVAKSPFRIGRDITEIRLSYFVEDTTKRRALITIQIFLFFILIEKTPRVTIEAAQEAKQPVRSQQYISLCPDACYFLLILTAKASSADDSKIGSKTTTVKPFFRCSNK